MKLKKNNKMNFIKSLSLIGLTSVLSIGIIAMNNNNINQFNNSLVTDNINNNFQLSNSHSLLNISNKNTKQFEGTILTKNVVKNLRWNTKSNIILEDWINDAPNITIIDNGAFENSAITLIEIPNKITLIGDNAFKDTTSLSSISIRPASELTTIGNGAFYNSRITSINIPNSVTSISSNAFKDTFSLQGGHIEMQVTLKQQSATPLYGLTQGQWNSITWREVPFQGQTLTKNEVIIIGWENKSSITLDDWALDAPKVTRIDSFAFGGLNLSSIVVPNKVTNVRANAFINTLSLNSITLPYHLYVDAAPIIPYYGFTISQWDAIIWNDYPNVGKMNNIIARELLRKSTAITWKEISKYDEIGNEAFKDTDISSIRIERKKNFSIGDNAFENTLFLNNIELSIMYKEEVTNFGLTEEQIAIIEYIDDAIPLTLSKKIAINVIIVDGVLVILFIFLWVLDWKSLKRRSLLELEQNDQLNENPQEYLDKQYISENDYLNVNQNDDENYFDFEDEEYGNENYENKY
ncbi:MAG: leucine-rich repeat protein [Metamycoplasmataceae bacterium]